MITVSIPVKTGGYTGQRDQWEQFTQDADVSIQDGQVKLESHGPDSRTIWFDLEELNRALGFYKDHIEPFR